MPVIYGITSCDTVRKARKWLTENDITHRYHDLRKDGVQRNDLARWIKLLGWETMVNRRSATWRALPESDRGDLDDGRAVELLTAHPTLIKRPVLESGREVMVGYTSERYEDFFK